jgi:hypothetical protein
MENAFGRRLRAAGVSFEDRQDFLGHKSSRITTHYSAAELTSLIAAAEKVCDSESQNSRATTRLRRRVGQENQAKTLSRQEKLARPERFDLPTFWFVGRPAFCRSFKFNKLDGPPSTNFSPRLAKARRDRIQPYVCRQPSEVTWRVIAIATVA